MSINRIPNTCDEVYERQRYYSTDGINPTPAPPEERCPECFMYGEHDERCATLFKRRVEQVEDQRPEDSM